MAPKQQRGEATVDRLLTSALHVYSTSGQQGFTVSAVTAASGVSLGSLYHHFGSFDGLAAALYTRCMQQLCDQVATALARSRTPRTGVRALVTAYLRFTQERPDAALFIHASACSGHLTAHADQISAAKAPMAEAIARWLQPRIEAGEVAPLPGFLIEMLVIGPVVETARRWLADPEDIDLAQALRILPDRIWRALQP
ncbi:TetR/AcrR family transcriptional regulator [Streptomyces sp. 4.24]|uniref:TetR/AcrR family transcriptional regulator n=1 Tax=Streptomyces tritrimontium TaxID=3406573 RepID=UPI003BB74AA8